MADDYQKATEEYAAFDIGEPVEYADGKRGVVRGYVPAVPETDSAREEQLWKELINRLVMDEGDLSLDGPIADPQYVVERKTGVTTVFGADELTGLSECGESGGFEIDDELS